MIDLFNGTLTLFLCSVLLQYKEEDGQKIEPEFFCPIIPLLLVNGSQGIGTGWSTFIPPYNPKDLLDYIQAKLDNADEMPALYPFARDFTGTIEPNSNGNGYVTYGRASVVNEKSIVIEELPLRMWTSTYKDYLLRMRDKGLLTTFVENHTTTKVSFTVNIRPNQIHKMSKSGLEKAFGLKSFLSTNNMYAFDASNQLKKFDKAEDIIDEYFPVRLELYHHRKSVIESEARYSAVLQRNKARFIQLVTNGEINIMSGRATKQETSSALANQGFSTLSELKAIRNDNSLYKLQQLLPEISEIETIDENDGSEFDYLLNMPLSSLTVEKISELKKDAVRKEEELDLTQSTTAADLWRQDLKSLAKHLK